MSTNEAKWRANLEKVAFLKQFPGLVISWEETVGHTVTTVTPLSHQPGAAVLTFSNDRFAVVSPLTPEPKALSEGIPAVRSGMESKYPEAYAHYDALADKDREAARQARLNNIIGAIHNNLDRIPELKDRLRSLVKDWNS